MKNEYVFEKPFNSAVINRLQFAYWPISRGFVGSPLGRESLHLSDEVHSGRLVRLGEVAVLHGGDGVPLVADGLEVDLEVPEAVDEEGALAALPAV